MAKKISVEELDTVLTASVQDGAEKERILAEVRNYIANLANDQDEAEPAVETRDVTILFGSQETIDVIDTDAIVAFTVKIEATSDHNQIIPHLLAKASIFNQNTRRRNSRIQNLGETFNTLSPKRHLDEFPKKILTKQASLVIKTTNHPIQSVVVR